MPDLPDLTLTDMYRRPDVDGMCDGYQRVRLYGRGEQLV